MPDLWGEVLAVVNSILTEMPYHGDMMNERYLHHFFSHRIQCAEPSPMPLLDPATPLLFHPEWPTYKEATKIACGTYQKAGGMYLPVEAGRKGGFIDFALGPYLAPEIAVEFKLFNNGWDAEGVTFDYMKLLDGRNTFKAVVSVVVILRPKRVTVAGWRDALERAINSAYAEAVRRLGGERCRPAADRTQRFVVTEIAPQERRHWLNSAVGGGFVEGRGVPLRPESG